jgi:hypothetical protein
VLFPAPSRETSGVSRGEGKKRSPRIATHRGIGADAFASQKSCQVMSSPGGEETGEGEREHIFQIRQSLLIILKIFVSVSKTKPTSPTINVKPFPASLSGGQQRRLTSIIDYPWVESTVTVKIPFDPGGSRTTPRDWR